MAKATLEGYITSLGNNYEITNLPGRTESEHYELYAKMVSTAALFIGDGTDDGSIQPYFTERQLADILTEPHLLKKA